MISARTTRAGLVQAPRPMARTTLPSDGPSTRISARARTKLGTVCTASVSRISASSTQPPRKPAVVPTEQADADRHRRRRGADQQRDAGAVEQLGQHVAAEPVGAQPMRRVLERRQLRRAGDRHRVAREDPAGGQRHAQHQHQPGEAEPAVAVGQEAAQHAHQRGPRSRGSSLA